MQTLSIILTIMGSIVLIFTVWNHRLIKKHLRQFQNNHRHISSLTDEKYFELKSRQDYIIAVSTIIFAVLSFIGYSSVENIKKNVDDQIKAGMDKLDTLNKTADSTSTNFSGLQTKGENFQKLVSLLESRVNNILNKDVIRQNIFIIDPLMVTDFPNSTLKIEFRQIKFKDLTTISGQKLPNFKIPPSILCFSAMNSPIQIKDLTTEGFLIYSYGLTEPSAIKSDKTRFSLWISEK